jgi:WD40 repeat protein
MGFGSSKKEVDENNEFYLEAFGYKMLKVEGLDLNKEEIKTSKSVLFEDIQFEEEIIDHADESGPVKPWLENVLAPNIAIEENVAFPNYNLNIDHVYGFKSENSRKNLFFYKNDLIIYSVSSICIIQNLDDNTQRLFGGFPLKEKKECHDNIITSIDLLNKEVAMVATGQCGLVPKILVWSPVNTEVVYARFEQPKGSQEVSALCFDNNGHYLASFGKDENNSYYIFDLRKKEMMWEKGTGDKEFLLDITFNKFIKDDDPELLLVGVNKIIISRPIDQYDKNLYDNKEKTGIFSACCYVSADRFLVGNQKGKLIFYLNEQITHQKKLSSGSIQNITYKKKLEKIFVTDSLYKVYIMEDKLFTERDSFTLKSVVKSIDVNDDFQMILGLKNGDIIVKHWEDKTKYEEVYLKSHCEGSICGMAYVPEYKLVTSGEDNKILLWNLRSKKCESWGIINPVEDILNIGDKNKSKCLAYHLSYEHVAVGTNIGTITVRRNPKDLNIKAVSPDINLGTHPIMAMEYTEYGDILLVTNENNECYLLNVNNNYSKDQKFELESYFTSFDIDEQAKFIRTCTKDNKFKFYDIEKSKEVQPDDKHLRAASWKTNTCKFSYTMQGIFQGSTNPNYISAVCKAHNKNLLAAGDDDYLLNLCNYPCITENPKLKKYRGHSGVIKKIIWNSNDNLIITIAENDKAIIVWSVEEVDK